MRVRLESIGCRLNIGEMEHLSRCFAAAGHRVVGPGDDTDLVIFNTCAVTHVASRKSRKVLRQMRRRHPGAALVATGCYAELSGPEVEALGVDLVVANHDKDRIPEVLRDAGVLSDADPLPLAPDTGPFPQAPGGRTRAFVKVQDGCDNRCTFCIVTVARGESRSRAPEDVVAEVASLARMGYQEAVLSGVHLGAYGHDRRDGSGLGELIDRLLESTEIPRLRLSSLEPWDLSPEFFSRWQNPRLQPHLHLPLQSGCDATLQRMARRTTRAEFSELLCQARSAIPELAVSTDLIVGFPGESESEFEASLGYVQSCGFSRLHVFRYSPRAGTAAARMPDRVDAEETADRSRRLHTLAAELEARYRARHRGRMMDVLWENAEPFGDGCRWNGLTGNYLRVVTDAPESVDLHNRVLDTEMVAEMPGALYGRTDLSHASPFEAGAEVVNAPPR